MQDKNNYHVIIACHESDRAQMETLLAGMEVYSNFLAFDMNALWRGELGDYSSDEMGVKPRIDAWHGFFWPGFPAITLANLLASVAWKDAIAISLIIQRGSTWQVLSLPAFHKLAHAGAFK